MPVGDDDAETASTAVNPSRSLVPRTVHGVLRSIGRSSPPASASEPPQTRGILRRPDASSQRPRGQRARVRWRTVLIGTSASSELERRELVVRELERRERAERFAKYSTIARLPALTFEELLIPLRVALPELVIGSPTAIALDVAIDAFELAWLAQTVLRQRRAAREAAAATVAAPFSSSIVARDVAVVLALHVGRAVFFATGSTLAWSWLQLMRLVRVRELVRFVADINNDLSTDTKFVAVYKFVLVLVSVPHWVACGWWLIANSWSSPPLELPTWAAQLELLTHNPELDPHRQDGWHQLLMAQYMAWAGMSSMGYGILLATQLEILYAAAVTPIQMVFYAYVLGTLFHYLVRVDENTLHFKELLKSVDEYAATRQLPPALAVRIREHFTFQHAKAASSISRVVSQMPVSLRTEVAVAQYSRETASTWLFHGCSTQFHDELALALLERYVLPSETLWKRGDGATELLWCVGGALHVTKQGEHMATIRSDLGPGQLVGEIAFIVGIPQPYTVSTTATSEVILVVLPARSWEELVKSYPEQAELATHNLLRRFGLDARGDETVDGGGFDKSTMTEDELREYELLRATIRNAIVERNEDAFAQMAMAVRQGDTEAIKALVTHGFDLSTASYDQRTALHLGVLEGTSAVVRLLLELHADVHARDRFGSTAMEMAVISSQAAMAEELSHGGATLQLSNPAMHLHGAAARGDVMHLTLMLEHSVDVSSANHDERTALHVVATSGDLRTTEFLLQHLADVTATDRWRCSALDDAIRAGHGLVARALMRARARPSAEHLGKWLREAAALGDEERASELVLLGAPLDSTDYDGRTALMLGVLAGATSVVSQLVCALADVSLADRWGRTPLVEALGARAREVRAEVVPLLISVGARAPPELAAEPSVQGILKAASEIDMLELRKLIRTRSTERARERELALNSVHEVSVSLKRARQAARLLAREHRALFKLLGRHVELWISSYAVEDPESDTDDEGGSEDEDGQRTGADRGDGPAEGRNGGTDEQARVGTSHVRALAGRLPDEGVPEAGAEGADATADPHATGHQQAASVAFHRLVLKLPAAEAGLAKLQELFAARLDPGRRETMKRAERRKAERLVLRTLLREELGVDDDDSIEMAEEVDSLWPRHAFISEGGFIVLLLSHRFLAHFGELHDRLRTRTLTPTADAELAESVDAPSPVWRKSRLSRSAQLSRLSRNKPAGLSAGSRAAGLRASAVSVASTGGDGTPPASPLAPKHSSPHPLHSSGSGSALAARPWAPAAGVESAPSTPPQRLEPVPRSAELVAEAAHVLGALFSLFDSRKRGSIRARDVRSLQGSLGEMGKHEIQSLFRHVSMAAHALMSVSGTGRSSSQRRSTALRRSSIAEDALSRAKHEAAVASAAARAAAAVAESDEADEAGQPGALAPASTADEAAADAHAEGSPAAETTVSTRISVTEHDDDSPAEDVPVSPTAAEADAPAGPDDGSAEGDSSPLFGFHDVPVGAALVTAQHARVDEPAVPHDAPGRAGDAGSSAAGGSEPTARDELGELRRLLGVETASGARGAPSADNAGDNSESHRRASTAPLQALIRGAPVVPGAGDGAADRSGRRGSTLSTTQRLPSNITRQHFMVGVAAWILAGHSAAAEDGSTSARPAGEEAGEEAGRAHAQLLPPLHLGAAPTVPSSPLKQSTQSARSAHSPSEGRAEEGAASAGIGGVRHKGARASPADDAGTFAQLSVALGTAAACAVLAETIERLLDTRRLLGVRPVSARELLAVMERPISLPEGTSAEHVRRWCAEALGLSLPLDGASDAVELAAAQLSGGNDGSLQLQAAAAAAPQPAPPNRGSSGSEERDGSSGAEPGVVWDALVVRLRERADQLRSSAGARGRLDMASLSRGARPGSGARGSSGGADDAARRPWYVISCRSPFTAWLHRSFLAATVFDMVLVPLQLAFFEDTRQMEWIHTLGFALDGFYVLRMAACFVTTYVNDNSVEVVEPRELRRHYRDTHFTLDLLASWPHDALAYGMGADPLVSSGLRLARLVNVRYVRTAFSGWYSKLSDTDLLGGLVVSLGVLGYMSHLCACVWNMMGYGELAHSLTDITWADEYEMLASHVGGHVQHYDSPEARMYDHYLISFNAVTSIISALGTAQVPANHAEMVFYIVLLVGNMTVYAWAVGSVSGRVMRLDDTIVAKRAQLELAHTYIAHIRVPSELKARLRKFFTQRLQSASLSQLQADAIYTALPMALQVEVSAHTNRALVANCALLRGCSGGFLDRVSSSLRERSLEPEASVYRQGEVCKELLLISSGELEAYREEEEEDGKDAGQMDVLGPGDTAGAVPFIFGTRHTLSARAGQGAHTLVFALSTEAYRAALKLFPAEEDRVLDNASAQLDGEPVTGRTVGTARTGTSMASGSTHADGSFTARSEGARSEASGGPESGLRSAQHALSAAARKRRQLLHARLCTACVKGDVDAVRRMLGTRAVEVNSADFDGRTVLHLAACGGSAPVVTLLLAHKADARAEDRRHATALDDALVGAHADVAALLSTHGGTRGSADMCERLCSAAKHADGSAELAQLCRFGVDVTIVTRYRRTALHVAAAEGHVENARLLLQQRADANMVDVRGATPLVNAVNFERDACIELLLEHGATLGPAFDPASSLCDAAARGDDGRVRRLLRAACEVNAADAHGRTALHLAASSRAMECLLLLLREPALQVNAEDRFGATALDDAEREEEGGEQMMCSMLRGHGARHGSRQLLRDSPVRRSRMDQQRAREMREAKARQTLAVRARLVDAWVEREREAAVSMRREAESAVALERARGAVLADERPEFWEQLYAFLESHRMWHRQAVYAVQPALQLWNDEARAYAHDAVEKMARMLQALLKEHAKGVRAMERLEETTFRKPAGHEAHEQASELQQHVHDHGHQAHQ